MAANRLPTSAASGLAVKSSLHTRGALKSLSPNEERVSEASPLTGPSPISEWDKSTKAGLLSGDAELEDVFEELIYVTQALSNIESREPDLK